jgi:hypothetical protein
LSKHQPNGPRRKFRFALAAGDDVTGYAARRDFTEHSHKFFSGSGAKPIEEAVEDDAGRIAGQAARQIELPLHETRGAEGRLDGGFERDAARTIARAASPRVLTAVRRRSASTAAASSDQKDGSTETEPPRANGC